MTVRDFGCDATGLERIVKFRVGICVQKVMRRFAPRAVGLRGAGARVGFLFSQSAGMAMTRFAKFL